MTSQNRIIIRWFTCAAVALAGAACGDQSVAPTAVSESGALSATKFWEVGSSVAWNATARGLVASRAVGSPAVQGRIFAYLSVAQYNAIVAAEDTKDRGVHASPAAAAAAASVVVLKSFFPLDADLLDATLLAQRNAEPWPGEKKSFAAGEAVGRAIGATVVAHAASDRFNLLAPPVNPGGAGNWTGVNPVRGYLGMRLFALTSDDQFRPGPPPAYLSPEFNAALAEVRAMSDGLTAAQLLIAQTWAARGPAYMNGVTSGMVVDHRRSEREGARILALANMAGFDVQAACFDAKFAYYLIRPSQADLLIKLTVGLPNHPSYPSGHSCITSAFATVLQAEFPQESDVLQSMIEEAGLARMYGGLHYRFDLLAGRELGRQVAEWVMKTAAPKGHNAIPLD